MKQQAKRVLSLLLALVLILGLTANAAQVGTQLDQTARYIHTTVKAPQVGSVGGEWAVLGLARSGYAVPDSYYTTYCNTVEDYVKDKSGAELAYACLDFVCDHWHHNGSSGMPRGRYLMDVVKFADENDHAVNCRGLSVILGILLRHVGLNAQHVTCLPYEYPFTDCHVVVDCFLPDGGRVMLDPTYRLHFTDDGGNPVSLPALRQHLIDGTAVHPNETAGYNGGAFDTGDYRDYMAKNTFRFSKGGVNREGLDEFDQLMLVPAGYPIEKTEPGSQAKILHDPDAFWG